MRFRSGPDHPFKVFDSEDVQPVNAFVSLIYLKFPCNSCCFYLCSSSTCWTKMRYQKHLRPHKPLLRLKACKSRRWFKPWIHNTGVNWVPWTMIFVSLFSGRVGAVFELLLMSTWSCDRSLKLATVLTEKKIKSIFFWFIKSLLDFRIKF